MHRIAILDLRILNLDRNVCNILVTSEHVFCEAEMCVESDTTCWKMIPIDHGLSFPDSLAVSSYEVAWLSFKQAE